MRTTLFSGALSLMVLFTATLKGQSRDALLATIRENPRWTPTGNSTAYQAENLAKLIGRRAIAITRYGFAGASTQSFQGPAGQVHLTLFEMTDSSAAYGLFTLGRDYNRPDFTTLSIGQEGFRSGNSLFFWQARYAVRLDGPKGAAEDVAQLLASNIIGRSSKPPVSRHLPPDNMVASSEKYLVDPQSFARELDLDPSPFGFDDGLEVAGAAYRVGPNTLRLVLFLYPTPQLAKKYAGAWETRNASSGPFHKRVGPLFALVQGTRDREAAKAVLALVNYESQVTWNEPRPDLTLPELILTIFSFIGVALLFTFVVGIGFGGLRLFVKARYPNKVFDRSEDVEIIQLKLAEAVRHKELTD